MTIPLTYPNKHRALRERMLSQRAAPLEPIEIDGEWYHMRTPTIADRDEVLAKGRPPKPPKRAGNVGSKAFAAAAEEEFDPTDPTSLKTSRMQAQAALIVACDDVGSPIFEPTDFDLIRLAPVGSSLETLAKECLARVVRQKEDRPEGEASGAPLESGSGTS